METLLLPLLGGVLIGCAAALLLLATGRPAGVSGILVGLRWGDSGNRGWRAAFLGGLVVAGLLGWWHDPVSVSYDLQRPLPLLALSGVLIGFGTRTGGGCTSGHGVCGVGQLSRRSIVATVVFVAVGMGTAVGARMLGGLG